MVTPDPIRPILSNVDFDHALAILGAMRSVAGAGRGSTAADAEGLRSAACYMLGYQGPDDPAAASLVGPEALATKLAAAGLREDSVRFLTIMALIDLPLDTGKLDAVLHHALPMAGHALPVIFSWHLATEISRVAGASAGGLDPEEVWRALAAGAQCPARLVHPVRRSGSRGGLR